MANNNPFIPMKKANTVIIDGRLGKKLVKKLEELNFQVIPTIECKELAPPIAYHPDIVMHPINHKTMILAANVFDYYEEIFRRMGIRPIRGESYLDKSYPLNIPYNVGRIGNYAIHNTKYTDEKLKFYLKKEGVELLHVEQGYSKCSMALVGPGAIVTADRPIHKLVEGLGYESLLIEPGYISLEGYPYGFIGGTCGKISKDGILLSGSLAGHPDRIKIENFIKKYNKSIICLSNDDIVDLGTIISLYC